MIFDKKFYCIALAVIVVVSIQARGAEVVNSFPTPWGYYAYGLTWDGQYLWCGDDRYGDVAKIDPSTGVPLDTIPGAPESNHGLAWDGTHLWVAGDYHTDYIYRTTTAGVRVDSILNPGGDYSGGMTWDGTHLWVTRYYPNTQPNLFRVDVSTGVSVDTIPSQGLQPQGLAWDGEYLWNVQDDNDDDPEKVWQLDPTTGDTLMWFWAPGAPDSDVRPRGLTWDGQYLWLVAKGSGTNDQWLFQIDPYGAGMPQIVLSDDEHDYGHTVIESPKDQDWDLGISNEGETDLIVDSLVSDNPAFVVLWSFPDTLVPNSTIYVPLRFSPDDYGAYTGTATVYSNDPLDPEVEVSLQGFGIYQKHEIDLSETAHDYGSRRICSKSGWWLTIQNQGGDPLVIDSVFTDNPDFYPAETAFQIDSTLSFDLRVWFSPSSAGDLSATMTIVSNDADEETLEVDLTGYGDDSPIPGGEEVWGYLATDWDPSIKAIQGAPDADGDGNDDVIAASENDTIYCFNGNSSVTADVIWTFDGSLYRDQELASVCDLDGDGVNDVVRGGWDKRIIAISGATGDTVRPEAGGVWVYDTRQDDPGGNGGHVYEVAEGSDYNGDGVCDILAAAGDAEGGQGSGRVYCLSGATGQALWKHRLMPYGIHCAVFSCRGIDDVGGDDDRQEVAAGSGDTESYTHRAWLLDGSDGDTLWTKTFGEAVWSVVPIKDISGDGKRDVIVGSGVFGGTVAALDATDGSDIWSPIYLDGGVEKIEIIPDVNESGFDDICPCGMMSAFLCIEGGDGSIIWSYPSGHMAFAMNHIPDVNGDNVGDVVAGSGWASGVDTVYCFNGKDGEVIWRRSLGSPVETVHYLSNLACSDVPVALAGSRDGQVKALAGREIIPVSVEEPGPATVPREFCLGQNYPNPFNPTTVIPYTLAGQRPVTLRVYNLLGQVVRTLVDGRQSPGHHTAIWNGRDDRGQEVASGVYFARLRSENFSHVRQMLLLK